MATEEDAEADPVVSDPLLFTCAPLSNAVPPNTVSRAADSGFGAFANRSLSFPPEVTLLMLKGSFIADDELELGGH